MSRRGKHAGFEGRGPAAGLNEVELSMELDLLRDTETRVEIPEVDAALEQDVLAVVDGFIGRWRGVGGGASAEEGACLKELDRMIEGTEGRCRRESSESAAYNDGAA